MSELLRRSDHPALAPALFFLVASMPVEVPGCRNRRLLADSAPKPPGTCRRVRRAAPREEQFIALFRELDGVRSCYRKLGARG